MKTRPPFPVGPRSPAYPPCQITYTLALPDGAKVVATMASHYESEVVPIHWSGSLTVLHEPPTRGDDCDLRRYLERTAADTGGKLKTECSGGKWLVKD